MGSLMAGWDSPVLDPESVKYKRNRSFTKEEIEAYWKLKKKTEEEHLKAISSPSNRCQDGTDDSENYGVMLKRSSSLPEAKTKETEDSLGALIRKNGWWTRSNSAFLNEPPVLERASNSYASQFHIATLSVSKANNSKISV